MTSLELLKDWQLVQLVAVSTIGMQYNWQLVQLVAVSTIGMQYNWQEVSPDFHGDAGVAVAEFGQQDSQDVEQKEKSHLGVEVEF